MGDRLTIFRRALIVATWTSMFVFLGVVETRATSLFEPDGSGNWTVYWLFALLALSFVTGIVAQFGEDGPRWKPYEPILGFLPVFFLIGLIEGHRGVVERLIP